jgi:PIN domain nuclease of toxin-antitoxin system
MNVLLDTHAFIWFAEDDPNISPAATIFDNTILILK